MKLRIACVQFNPILSKVEANAAKIRSLVSNVRGEIDLLVLPELSLTGYNFRSPKEIEPFLENSTAGPSASLAQELSKKFQCTTVIGYPETHQETTYNSALVVNELGKIVFNYRKTHLYETDKTWGCQENPDKLFRSVVLDLGRGANRKSVVTNIGICMDLNPYEFEAPFNEFEFSTLCWANDSSLVIVPTAWLSPDSPSTKDDWSEQKKKEDKERLQAQFQRSPSFPVEDSNLPSQLTVDYWILRFFPFLSHRLNGFPRKNRKTTVVMCNRTGIEDDVFYGGSSSIFQFDPSVGNNEAIDATNPSVNVFGSLGRATEEILYQEVDV